MNSVVRSLSVAVAVVVAIAFVGGAPPSARADRNDRDAARLLDAVPLPPPARPDHIGERVRTYTTSDPPDAVLEFVRDGLRAAGWEETSVGLAPASNNSLDGGQDQGTTNGGAETS